MYLKVSPSNNRGWKKQKLEIYALGGLGLWLNRLVLKELKIRSKQIVNIFVAQISYAALLMSGLQFLNALR